MSALPYPPEVVTGLDRCAEIVKDLMDNHTAIAVDAEGVNLGKTGPLTLLQVGTRDGRVYLFDIETNKTLLTKGYLKDVLELSSIVKIIQSCRGDSAALRAQFGVLLNNVFDTQIAHLVFEEFKGVRLPLEVKLTEICDMYGGSSAALSSKDDIKKAWTVTAGYWAIRPLKEEMIEYAAADVQVLFPVYDHQFRLLQEKGLQEKFEKYVKDDIVVQTDNTVQERKTAAFNQKVETILMEIAEKCNSGDYRQMSDLNEDESRAMGFCRTDQIISSSSGFKAIRQEKYRQFIEDTEQNMAEAGDTYEVPGGLYGKLKSNENLYPGTDIDRKIKTLLQKVKEFQLEHIKRKYNPDTPLEYIRGSDTGVIKSVRIDSESNPTLRALFSRVQYQDFVVLRDQIRQNPRDVKIHKGLHGKIRFLATRSSGCSQELKQLSKELWVSFVRKYGKDHNY